MQLQKEKGRMSKTRPAAKVKRCSRCNRRLRGTGAAWLCLIDLDDDGWGSVPGVVCPGCTTDEEHTQREINDAITDYVWRGDRLTLFPKVSSGYGGLN
jgi:hypothetical protein